MRYSQLGKPGKFCRQIEFLLGLPNKSVSAKRSDYFEQKDKTEDGEVIRQSDPALTFTFPDGTTLDLALEGAKIMVSRELSKDEELLKVKNCKGDKYSAADMETGERTYFQFYERSIKPEQDPEKYVIQMFCDACYFVKEIKEAIDQ